MNSFPGNRNRQNFRIPSKFKKKLKIFLGIGLAGFVVTLLLMGWAGVATVKYVANLAQDPNVEGQLENLQGRAENLQAELQNLPALAKLGCWDKAQSLANFEIWLEKPIGTNIEGLKAACLEKKVETCQGADCETAKQIKT